jgi:hypothetical protein
VPARAAREQVGDQSVERRAVRDVAGRFGQEARERAARERLRQPHERSAFQRPAQMRVGRSAARGRVARRRPGDRRGDRGQPVLELRDGRAERVQVLERLGSARFRDRRQESETQRVARETTVGVRRVLAPSETVTLQRGADLGAAQGEQGPRDDQRAARRAQDLARRGAPRPGDTRCAQEELRPQGRQRREIAAAHPAQDQRLERVVGVVRREDRGDLLRARDVGQLAVARRARARLEAGRIGIERDPPQVELDVQGLRELGAEARVGRALRAAQPVVDVHRDDARPWTRGSHEAQEVHAVRAAGERDADRGRRVEAERPREPLPALRREIGVHGLVVLRVHVIRSLARERRSDDPTRTGARGAFPPRRGADPRCSVARQRRAR